MKKIIFLLVSIFIGISTSSAHACGGFFCAQVPVLQAGEQIIFKQEGRQNTTMVRILYTGDAEEFAWVLPVPETPELSIGSDITFTELELLTRPQFSLERTGSQCPTDFASANFDLSELGAPQASATATPEPVVVEQSLEVGPFDAQIVSSDDATAMATWLQENNFDLSEQGSELLSPYIEAGMKFVVLKLQSNSTAGDIQPIILKYESDKPMIPIKLTAIAAQQDMGILVWVLGSARAVPDNFLHVVPNYTRLNWYTGSNNAYASYQTLITAAMNEAGGQGFATDYAEQVTGLDQNFTNSDAFTQTLSELENATNAEFINELYFTFLNNIGFMNRLNEALPLPSGQDFLVYGDVLALTTQFDSESLSSARTTLQAYVEERIIAPLDNANDILDDDLYLTRLYTTLSPEEMLTDPTFVFNPDMPGQPTLRQATLNTQCVEDQNQYTLTLGEGTDRNGEVVLQAADTFPNTGQVASQDASWQIAVTAEQGAPQIQKQANFETQRIGTFKTSGGGSANWFFVLMITVLFSKNLILRK